MLYRYKISFNYKVNCLIHFDFLIRCCISLQALSDKSVCFTVWRKKVKFKVSINININILSTVLLKQEVWIFGTKTRFQRVFDLTFNHNPYSIKLFYTWRKMHRAFLTNEKYTYLPAHLTQGYSRPFYFVSIE